MHPHTFYATLFNQAKRDEVFVIMSFAPEFEARWQQVIWPCIADDLKLAANRVDYNTSGESVIHDILDGIAHARLIIADITSSRMMDGTGNFWPQRNANVMWELGLAHVMRLPDEVLVVRSDNEPTIFDLTQFRAFPYDPADTAASREMLRRLANDRLRPVDQSASSYVSHCAESLDHPSITLLTKACCEGFITQPEVRSLAQVIGALSVIPAISRLLEIGALTTDFLKVTEEVLTEADVGKFLDTKLPEKYNVTPLGTAIMKQIGRRMNLHDPKIQPLMEKLDERLSPRG